MNKTLHGCNESQPYLGVFFVPTVDLGDALFGAFSGGRGGEGLLHPAGPVPQTALDTESLVELVHLSAQTERHSTLTGKCPKKST